MADHPGAEKDVPVVAVVAKLQEKSVQFQSRDARSAVFVRDPLGAERRRTRTSFTAFGKHRGSPRREDHNGDTGSCHGNASASSADTTTARHRGPRRRRRRRPWRLHEARTLEEKTIGLLRGSRGGRSRSPVAAGKRALELLRLLLCKHGRRFTERTAVRGSMG
jgi:hypothetical protein